MKSKKILLAVVSLSCMAELASAQEALWQIPDLNANQLEGAPVNAAGEAITKDIVLPDVFFKTDKSNKALSAREISPVEALGKAFSKGRTPTKADMLDYSIGWYLPTDPSSSDLSILMFGFKAMPNDLPGELFQKETYVRMLTFKDRDFLRNATAKDLQQFDDELANSPCYGPILFIKGSILANATNRVYSPRWEFRVYEKYLLVEVTHGSVLGYGYFYKKLKEPTQAK